MSASVLSQFALDDVVDGSSPNLTSIPHSRISRRPGANHYLSWALRGRFDSVYAVG
jgi:hypothetical protein